ncbi:hypothetical protein, partial [Fervidobacterium sp.]
MGEMIKLIFVLLLVILVVIISVNSKRQISLDWQTSQHVSESLDTLVPTVAQSVQSGSAEEVSQSPTTSENYTQSTSSQVSKQDTAKDTEYTEYSATGVETSETSDTTSILLIPLVTTATETTNMTALDIYNELKEVEQATRKYISGGFKISTLNSQSIYSKGYMDEYLAERYEVGYKLSGEGYTIFIKP